MDHRVNQILAHLFQLAFLSNISENNKTIKCFPFYDNRQTAPMDRARWLINVPFVWLGIALPNSLLFCSGYLGHDRQFFSQIFNNVWG